MKSVLISIQPKWCELIASGKKTVEVRKSRPKLETPFKCYIYCTYGKMLYEDFPNGIESRQIKLALYSYVGQSHALNGKVIGEFMCDRIDKFTVGSLGCDDIERLACLTYREMLDYFYKPNELDGKTVKFGYGWHISDLKIYDKPKELWHFLPPCNSDGKCFKCRHYDYFIDPTIDAHCRQMERDIERPPMSWCYVEELWGV